MWNPRTTGGKLWKLSYPDENETVNYVYGSLMNGKLEFAFISFTELFAVHYIIRVIHLNDTCVLLAKITPYSASQLLKIVV